MKIYVSSRIRTHVIRRSKPNPAPLFECLKLLLFYRMWLKWTRVWQNGNQIHCDKGVLELTARHICISCTNVYIYYLLLYSELSMYTSNYNQFDTCFVTRVFISIACDKIVKVLSTFKYLIRISFRRPQGVGSNPARDIFSFRIFRSLPVPNSSAEPM